MSVSEKKDVPQLVEKYRTKYPRLERPILRKLIRLENKIENASDKRKLDRYLKKAFKTSKTANEKIVNNENHVKKKNRLGIFDWWEKRAERKARERHQELLFLEAEIATDREKLDGTIDPNDPEYLKKVNELRLANLRKYGLIP